LRLETGNLRLVEKKTENVFRGYKDLEVWQKAMVLTKAVYQATTNFPSEERFGLVNQMRRAAVSIPSNLAEGHARAGVGEFRHFVSIAMGSTAELETQVLLSVELGYLSTPVKDTLLHQLDTVGKMLRGLHKSLGARKQFSKSQVSSF
jgi:four helix bundle protein